MHTLFTNHLLSSLLSEDFDLVGQVHSLPMRSLKTISDGFCAAPEVSNHGSELPSEPGSIGNQLSHSEKVSQMHETFHVLIYKMGPIIQSILQGVERTKMVNKYFFLSSFSHGPSPPQIDHIYVIFTNYGFFHSPLMQCVEDICLCSYSFRVSKFPNLEQRLGDLVFLLNPGKRPA